MPLPINVDSTYPDNADDPSAKEHQQHHDQIHEFYNIHENDPPIVTLTQAEYDALGSPDPGTLYVITG